MSAKDPLVGIQRYNIMGDGGKPIEPDMILVLESDAARAIEAARQEGRREALLEIEKWLDVRGNDLERECRRNYNGILETRALELYEAADEIGAMARAKADGTEVSAHKAIGPEDKRGQTTVKEIVAEYLKSHGYHGLYNEAECGCEVNDLMPCAGYGGCYSGCLPGVKVPPPPGEDEVFWIGPKP